MIVLLLKTGVNTDLLSSFASIDTQKSQHQLRLSVIGKKKLSCVGTTEKFILCKDIGSPSMLRRNMKKLLKKSKSVEIRRRLAHHKTKTTPPGCSLKEVRVFIIMDYYGCRN